MSINKNIKPRLAVLGECMVEIKPTMPSVQFGQGPIDAHIRYGGDTLNCSVYLARMGVDVSYVTALGDDPLSDWMVGQWQAEGINCDQVRRAERTVPGLYLIDTDEAGERSFFYWRDQAPARSMFDDPQKAGLLFESLRSYAYIYLSGITLALFNEPIRRNIYAFLDDFRANGGKVCFDNNYRPRQWPDATTARAAFESLYQRSDIALPTLEDEQLLYAGESEQDTVDRILTSGAPEIVIKKGALGCRVVADGIDQNVTAQPVDKVVDTTAAGDSFNAGYLAARFAGRGCIEASEHGHKLAATVVQYPGAIIPREKMPF